MSEIENKLRQENYETYIAKQKKASRKLDGKIVYRETPLINTLMFVNASHNEMKIIDRNFAGRLMIYRNLDSKEYATIPNTEMEIFKLTTSSGDEGLEYLGSDTEAYSVGEPVMVTGGPFEGAVGKIFRIKGDKRLVVTINGICAVATSYIPRCFLKKI